MSLSKTTSSPDQVHEEHVSDEQLANIAGLDEHHMGPLQAIRRRPQAFCWALVAVFASLLMSFENQAAGMVLSIPEFRKDFGYYYEGSYVLHTEWQSAFYGGPIASAILGTLSAGYLADKFGRKWTLISSLVITFAAVAMEFVALTNGLFFGGKFLNGYVSGIILTVAVTYIGEVSPLALRGVLTCMTALMMTIGPLTAAIIVNFTGEYENRWAYRAILCAQFGFAGISLPLTLFMPESPVYYLNIGKEDKARKMVARLGYKGDHEIDPKIAQLKALLEEARIQSEGTYLDCFRKPNIRRTIISVMPLAIQALSGVYFISAYGTYYIQLAGFSTAESFKLQIAQHGCSMFGNIISWFLIDRVGRRPLTFWGTMSITIVLIICGSLATEGSAGSIKGAVAMIIIYNWFYNISIGATAYTLLAEVSSSQLRAKTVSIGIALQYLIYLVWAFVIPYIFNPDQANLGAKTSFIFGGLGVLSLIYLWFYQVETSGRTFEELDEMFKKGLSVREFKNYKTEQQRFGEEIEGKLDESK
ncbi:hypothetical protein MKZ38_005218 [Zalerion maritima]|uniref:Major facilitator superfamily (MFS) profile domain-containing protein n=1 Tax=Zalerion maritima TaxID=339359 RepID=A0AAD5WQF4_9PEZI|nr:hypothetical protein MKZ38_005218 [Zalerion maritima]